MKKYLNTYWPFFIIMTVAVISRLPQLMSVNFVLDGDECVVGLMSKHFIEGKTVPYFFYGQNYGFSFIEVLAITVGYTFAGISDYAVKLSVFVLWLVGVLFFYKSLLAINPSQKWVALAFALILVLCPAWAVWSMKARGGYLTSFMLSNIVLYICLSSTDNKWTWLLAGVLCVTIFYSQPLWLPGLLLFVLYGISKRNPLSKIVFFILGILPSVLFFTTIKQQAGNYWRPNIFSQPTWERVVAAPSWLYDSLTGYYYLNMKSEADTATHIFVILFIATTAIAVCVALYTILKPGKKQLLIVALISLAASVLPILFVEIYAPRYMLPVTCSALLLIVIVGQYIQEQKVLGGTMVCLAAAGTIAMMGFKNYQFDGETKAEVIDAIRYLEKRDIKHVYCSGSLVQWKLIFYSNERVIARYYSPVERYMPYVKVVDSAFHAQPQKVAIVGVKWQVGGFPPGMMESINKSFFMYRYPNARLLNKSGFDF